MNKKILTIAVALVVFAVVVAPAAAQLPVKDPLPKGNPWDTIWKWLTDLQTQITDLAARVTNVETEVDNINATHLGEVSYHQPNLPDSPFTQNDVPTDLIVTAWAASDDGNPVALTGEIRDIDPDFPNQYSIAASSFGAVRGTQSIASISMPVAQGEDYLIGWSGNANNVRIIERPLVNS